MRRVLALLIGALMGGAALHALAQDRDRDRDRITVLDENGVRQDFYCKLKSLTCEKVVAVIYEDGRPKRRTYESEQVVAVELAPARKSKRFVEGEGLFSRGRWEAAMDAFGRVANGTRDPIEKQVAYYKMGEAAYRMGAYQKAIDIFRAFIRSDENTWYLPRVHERIFESYRAKNDLNGARQALRDFQQAGQRFGKRHWSKMADLLNANLEESQGNFNQAKNYYTKYEREQGKVGEEARCGVLRCLAALGNTAAARAKAQSYIQQGRKRLGDRTMIAAFNALGDYQREQNNLKEALLAYLRGICEFENADTMGTPEHARSLAMSALLMARYGATLDPQKKEVYMDRANRLYAELQGKYPDYDKGGEILKEIRSLR